MTTITIKPSAMPNKQWRVGDIYQDQEGRQYRINDWDWETKVIELIELDQDERNHLDYISGTLDTSKSTPKI